MGTLIAVSRAADRFITGIGKTASWLLMPLMGVILLDVITRKFNLLTDARDYFADNGMIAGKDFIEAYLTSTKFQELEWHLHAALFLLCLGFGYVKNSHVRIEIIRERFSLRVKAWLELIGVFGFIFPYASLILYFGFDFAQRSYALDEVSAALTGLSHRWIIKSFVPIGMVLVLIAAIAVALRNIVYLFGSPELRDQAQKEAGELHLPEEQLPKIDDASPAGHA